MAVKLAVVAAVAVLGAVLVAVGVAMVFVPAGVIWGGGELIAAAWAAAYMLRRAG